MPATTQAWLGLGGNLGDVPARFAAALAAIEDHPDCTVTDISPLYSTPPWGITDQPRFINACAGIRTALAPEPLLDLVKMLEREAGRTQTVRNGPRPLDIDILLYGDASFCDPRLEIPHPRMLERAFVMVPLADIAPDLMLDGKSVAARAAQSDRAGMERLDRTITLPGT